MYKDYTEALAGPFGDKELNLLVLEHLKEKDPAKKEDLYRKIARKYPGTWGPDNTISEQAHFVLDSYREDLQRIDDENGDTFGDDLT